MGQGVSSGGGQSSLGYLFGSGEAPKPSAPVPQSEGPAAAEILVPMKCVLPPIDKSKKIPTGIQGSQANNYFRADGQNIGNFITICVYNKDSMGRGVSSGGGQSSLGYLFGSGEAPKPSAPVPQSKGPAAAEIVVPMKCVLSPEDKSKQIPAGI